MNIGDQVRFIHQTGNGIIKKILANGTLEIEIEDGFLIPAKPSEIVVVAKEESIRFRSSEIVSKEATKIEQVLNEKGFSLAFVPFNDKVYKIYLLNNTSFDILFTVCEQDISAFTGIASGIMKKKSSIALAEYKQSDFEAWPTIHIKALYFKQGSFENKTVLEKQIKCKAATFFKNKKHSELLNQQAFVYSLDDSVPKINSQTIVESMFEPKSSEKSNIAFSESEVDLHIEQLTHQYQQMQPFEMLELQLRTFQNKLDAAIVNRLDSITFIHGSGTGKLKTELHRLLARDSRIKYFQDARKDKFGYGATYVKLI